jgi:uncharacterized protein (TIGR03503 family)
MILHKFSNLKSAVVAASVFVLTHISAQLAWGEPNKIPDTGNKLDVILMLDSSGSMLKTDPKGLRYEGAKILFSFLTESDRLGIVQFAGDAKVVQELEYFSPSKIEESVSRIKAIPNEGVFTDIAQGVKVASELLDKAPRTDTQRLIVLLSDGKSEPDPAVSPAFARTLQLIHEILPDVKSREAKIFTLALSKEADRAFLAEVATATDGLSWYTQTPEEIHTSFGELFLAVKRPQVVSQTGRGFSIDADVDEATFYINHEPDAKLTLLSPKDESMTAERHPDYVTWFTGQNFDVITVKEPDLGDWRVTGSTLEDGFATVLTDLKLLTDWPLVIRAGDEPLVKARLYEEQKPISLPEISGVVKFGFQIVPTDKVSKPIMQEPLFDDGTHGDVVAQDGIFSSATGAIETGAYKLTVVAKGPTFQRSQQIPFTVRPRLVTLQIRHPSGVFKEEVAAIEKSETPEGEHKQEGEAEHHARSGIVTSGDETSEFIVSVSKESATFKSFEVMLVALTEDRQRIDLELKRLNPANPEYSALADRLPKDGRYKIKAVLSGRDKKGDRIEAESPVITLNFKARTKREDSEIETGHKKHEEQEKKSSDTGAFPLTSILIITALNAAGFFAAFKLLKKKSKSGSAGRQRYLPPAQLLEAIEVLEQRASAKSITLDDSIFKLVEMAGTSVEDVDLAAQPLVDKTSNTEATEGAV